MKSTGYKVIESENGIYKLDKIILDDGIEMSLDKYIDTLELFRLKGFELELAGYRLETLILNGLFLYKDFEYYVINFNDFSKLGINTVKIINSIKYMLDFHRIKDLDNRYFMVGFKSKYNIAILEVGLPVYLDDKLVVEPSKNKLVYARLMSGLSKNSYFLSHFIG